MVKHTPLIPALRRQRKAELYEFEASLVYRASTRTVRAVTQRKFVSKSKKSKTKILVKISPRENISIFALSTVHLIS